MICPTYKHIFFTLVFSTLSLGVQAMETLPTEKESTVECKSSPSFLQAMAVGKATKDLHPVWATKDDSNLNALLIDSAKYEFEVGTRVFQAGNNLEHCVWVHNEAAKLLAGSPYAAGIELTQREKDLFILAGLLHDVGKQGRNSLFDKLDEEEQDYWYTVECDAEKNITKVIYRFDKESHCMTGFNMILNKKTYRMCNNENFDFDALFEELGVNEIERNFIAILVGIHFSFGNVKNSSMPIPDFIAKLQNLITNTNYNNGVLDIKMLRLAILIQVADIFGLCPCCTSDYHTQPVREVPFVAAQRFGYVLDEHNTSPALAKMLEVIEAFNAMQTQATEPVTVTE